jgi:hypothetical protein
MIKMLTCDRRWLGAVVGTTIIALLALSSQPLGDGTGLSHRGAALRHVVPMGSRGHGIEREIGESEKLRNG